MPLDFAKRDDAPGLGNVVHLRHPARLAASGAVRRCRTRRAEGEAAAWLIVTVLAALGAVELLTWWLLDEAVLAWLGIAP